MHDFTHTWNVKTTKEQTHRDRQQIGGYQRARSARGRANWVKGINYYGVWQRQLFLEE